MKHIIPFFAILLTPLCLFADEPQWKHFVKEETLLIAHVDLTKIDIEQTLQNNASIVEAVLKAIPSGVQDTRSLIPLAKMGKAFLTETLGIQEAYLVVNMQIRGMVALILPKTEKIDVEMLKKILPGTISEAVSKGCAAFAVASSNDDKFIVLCPLVGTPSDLTDLDEHIDLFIPPTPAERPDFAEAFAAIKDAPIQIAAAPPEFARKVIRDTHPKLPSPFDNWDIVTPLSELRWKAVGIEPAKPAIYVTAAMTSELTAQSTLQGWQEAIPIVLDGVPTTFPVSSTAVVGQPEIKENLVKNQERILALFALKAEGKNLMLRWEKPQFDEMLEIMSPLIEELASSESARMMRLPCVTKMKMLLLSFHNYADTMGNMQFPPPFTVDANGKPLHSWRVLVLPFLEQAALYKQIRLDEPWDSEHNKQFHDKMPAVFRCPAGTGNPNRDTVYCQVVGKETIGVPDGKGSTFRMITDGTSSTIALVERKTPVCWMEPVDVLQEHAYLGVNKHEFGIGSEHSGGAVVAIADGSLRFMKEGISLDFLKALLTKAGGEVIPYDEGEFLESVR